VFDDLLPIDAPGYLKLYCTPIDAFWCCTGTGIENHAKYGDSIYFHGTQDRGAATPPRLSHQGGAAHGRLVGRRRGGNRRGSEGEECEKRATPLHREPRRAPAPGGPLCRVS
jgi:hypothetical protein